MATSLLQGTSNTTSVEDLFSATDQLLGRTSAPRALGISPQEELFQRTDELLGIQPATLTDQPDPEDVIVGRIIDGLLSAGRGFLAVPIGAERIIAAALRNTGVSIPQPLESIQQQIGLAQQITQFSFGLEPNELVDLAGEIVGGVVGAGAGIKALNASKPLLYRVLGQTIGPGVFRALSPTQMVISTQRSVRTAERVKAMLQLGAGGALFEAGLPDRDAQDIVLGGSLGMVAGGVVGSLAVRRGVKELERLGLEGSTLPGEVLRRILQGEVDVPARFSTFLGNTDAQADLLRGVQAFDEALDDQAIAAVHLALQSAGKRSPIGAVRGIELVQDKLDELVEAFPNYRFEMVPDGEFGQTLLYGLKPELREGKAIGFLTDSAIDFYNRNGFMLGQRGLLDGQEVILQGIKQDALVVRAAEGRPGIGNITAPADRVTILDDVPSSFGGSEELFPGFQNFLDGFDGTWDEAFNAYANALPDFDQALKPALREFFIRRTARQVRLPIDADDPGALEAFKRAHKAVTQQGADPNTSLSYLAASRGYMMQRISGGRVKLTKVATGDTRLMSNNQDAAKFLSSTQTDAAVDLTPGMQGAPADLLNGVARSGLPANPSKPPRFEEVGIGTALQRTASDRKSFSEAFFRGPKRLLQLAETRAQEFETRGIAPNLWSTGVQPVSEAATRALNRSQPFLGRLRKLIPLVKADRRPVIRGWLTSELKPTYAAANNMTAKEVRAAEGLRVLFNDLFDEFSRLSGSSLSADDWFRNYAPDLSEYVDTTGEVERFRQIWSKRGQPLPPEVEFFAEMFKERSLSLDDAEDIFTSAVRYIRGGFFKVEAKEPFEAAVQFAKTVEDRDAQRFLAEYLMSVRGMPEMSQKALEDMAVNLFGSLGVRLSPKAARGIVNDLWGLNVGALMAYRPALVVRNMTQTTQLLAPLMPRGFSRVASAMQKATTAAGREYAEKVAAVRKQAPVTSAQFTESLDAGIAQRAGGRVIRAAREATRQGLRPYAAADEWNRAVTAIAVRDALDAGFKRFSAGKINVNRLMRQGGIQFLDPTVQNGFITRLETEGFEAARDFAAREMANFTQFLYGSANAPQWVRNTFGRLFGNYSTYPFGYLNWISSVMRRGSLTDRVSALAKHGTVNAALWGGPVAAGVNVMNWMPFWGMGYTGGPFAEVAFDVWNVARGFSAAPRGFDPPPEYNISLDRLPSHAKLLIPGGLMFRDLRRGAERLDSGEIGLAILESLGVRTEEPSRF